MHKSDSYKRIALALAAGTAATLGFVVKLSQQLKDMQLHILWKARQQPSFVYDTEDDEGRPMRVLSVGGRWQSGCYLDESLRTTPPFAYLRSFDHMFDTALPISKVLVVGGGAYSYPKHLVSSRDEIRVDVVEPDHAITQAAYDYFFLKDCIERTADRLRIIPQYGHDYLSESIELYDVIINDAFDGAQPSPELAGERGALLARDHLIQGGLYMLNVVCSSGMRGVQSLQRCVEELGRVFTSVHVIPCSDEGLSDMDNYLVIGSDGAHSFIGELAGGAPQLELD